MLNLEEAAAFIDITEQRSLSRAARKRGVAQTTLGRVVDRLEQRFAVKLLHRSTRDCALTAAGELFLRQARELVERARELERALAELSSAPSGTLRASLCTGYGRYRLAAPLAEFVVRHPKLKLEVRFEDHPADLSPSGVDLAVRVVRTKQESVICTPLERYPHMLVAAPSYLERRGVPGQPADLAQHSCLAMRTERVWNLWPFRRSQSLQEIRVEAQAEVNDPDALLALAISGAGITVLPAFLAQAALQRGQLTRVLPEYALPEGRAFVMHAARRTLPRAARDLLDCFRAAAAQRGPRSAAITA